MNQNYRRWRPTVSATILCAYAAAAGAFDVGDLSSTSRPGDFFIGRVPVHALNTDVIQYGIYSVTSFTQGQHTYRNSETSIELIQDGRGNYYLQITGPKLSTTEPVVFTLSAMSGPNDITRTYQYDDAPHIAVAPATLYIGTGSPVAPRIASESTATAPHAAIVAQVAAPAVTPPTAPPEPVATPTPAVKAAVVPVTPVALTPAPVVAAATPAHAQVVQQTVVPKAETPVAHAAAQPVTPAATESVAAAANSVPSAARVPKPTADSAPKAMPSPSPTPVAAAPAPTPAPVQPSAPPAPAVVATSSPTPAAYANPSTPAIDATAAKGSFAQLAVDAEKRLGLKSQSQPVVVIADGTLDHLTAAESWRLNAAFRRSLEQYDAAEQSLKSVEQTGAATGAVQQVTASLTSETTLPYIPSPAEAVLMNFYKAVSFWSLGDDENTGIELRRAEYRTAHAVDRYQSTIDKNKNDDAMAKAAAAVLDNKDSQAVVAKDEFDESMVDYAAYADAVNPAITYVHALFESRKGDNADVSDAANLMSRVNGILKGHESVAKDLADLNAGMRPCPTQDCVWIVTEEGQGPALKEATVQIGNNIALPGVVIPSIKFAVPQLFARGKYTLDVPATLNGQSIVLHELGNMNRVIRTEFDKRYLGIVTRTAIATTIKTAAKTAAMVAAEKKGGMFGGFAAKLGSDALDSVTHADTRAWGQTPGGWSLARVDHATAGTLSIAGVKNLPLPPWPALVYVKYAPGQSSGAPPIVEVLKL